MASDPTLPTDDAGDPWYELTKAEAARLELKKLLEPARLSVAGMLDSEPPVRSWLVENLIPRGAAGLLAAPGGTGKGHLCMQLALSLATAEPFGPFGVKDPSGVLWVSREDDRDEMHRRLVDAVAARWVLGVGHVRKEQIERNLHIADMVGVNEAVLSDEFTEALIDSILETHSELVILDPLGKLRPPGQDLKLNDAETAAYMISRGDQVARETGATVLLICHVNKAAQRDGKQLDSTAITGSGQFVDLARWAINLRALEGDDLAKYGLDRGDGHLELKPSKANYSPALTEPVVWKRSRGGALVHIETRMTKDVDADRVFQALAEIGEPVRADVWERECGHLEPKVSVHRARAARRALVASGRVSVVTETGRMGRPKELFQVAR